MCDVVDVRLPFNAEELLQNIFIVLASIFMIVVSSPWFALALLPPAVVFVFLQRIASVVMREVERSSRARSPWGTWLAGVTVRTSNLRSSGRGFDSRYYDTVTDRCHLLSRFLPL